MLKIPYVEKSVGSDETPYSKGVLHPYPSALPGLVGPIEVQRRCIGSASNRFVADLQNPLIALSHLEFRL